MRFGVSAENQRMLSEERRQSRRVLKGAEGLADMPVSEVEHLNQDDGSGTEQMTFMLGLDDPFGTTPRTFKVP